MQRLLFSIFVERAISLAVAFGASVFTLRYLGPSNNAHLANVLAIATVLSVFVKMGTDDYLTAHASSMTASPRTLFLKVLGFRSITMLFAWMIACVVLAHSFPDKWPSVAILVCVLILFQASDVGLLWLRAQMNNTATHAIIVACSCCGAVVVFALIAVGADWQDFLAQPIVYAAGIALASGLAAWRLERRPVGSRDARVQLPLGQTLAVALIAVVFFRLDALLLPAALSPAVAGVYLAAARVADVVPFALNAIATNAMTYAARPHLTGKQRETLIFALMNWVTWLGMAAAAGIIFMYWIILSDFLGPQYFGALPPIIILTLGAPLYAHGALIDIQLTLERRMDVVLVKSATVLAFKAVGFAMITEGWSLAQIAALSVASVFFPALLIIAIARPSIARGQLLSLNPMNLPRSLRITKRIIHRCSER